MCKFIQTTFVNGHYQGRDVLNDSPSASRAFSNTLRWAMDLPHSVTTATWEREVQTSGTIEVRFDRPVTLKTFGRVTDLEFRFRTFDVHSPTVEEITDLLSPVGSWA